MLYCIISSSSSRSRRTLENRKDAHEDRLVELEAEVKAAKASALEWEQKLSEVGCYK